MKEEVVYQVSTLQALLMGYMRSSVTVEELLSHGNIGLGTFEDVDGEMIVVDGKCYRATENGRVVEPDRTKGVPFAAVAKPDEVTEFDVPQMNDAAELKNFLNNKVDAGFGLNYIHFVRIDGEFSLVDARSEYALRASHTELKQILAKTQKSFQFENIKGTAVCVYFPDYLDTINAAGWHIHFISEDRTLGGHVFEVKLKSGKAAMAKIDRLELQLPRDAAFDTYSLKEVKERDIKEVE